MKHRVFDSIADFVAQAKNTPCFLSEKHVGDPSWTTLTHKQTVDRAIVGDDLLADKAMLLLDQIEVQSVATDVVRWSPSPYGAYPVVPEFLAGNPDCMRARQSCEGDALPCVVWVNLTCNRTVTADQMFNRGIAILALVLKLQAVRPVELKLFRAVEETENGLVIQVNSRPLDVATAAFALCNVAFVRHLVFGYMRASGWEHALTDIAETKRRYNIADTDIVIPSISNLTARSIDPVAWVNEQIAELGKGE